MYVAISWFLMCIYSFFRIMLANTCFSSEHVQSKLFWPCLSGTCVSVFGKLCCSPTLSNATVVQSTGRSKVSKRNPCLFCLPESSSLIVVIDIYRIWL
uniref:Putative secreted protein n=1 Tax=Ixodes ricinus TaxID=34613 RepID=A0A6B0U4S7_IXORI